MFVVTAKDSASEPRLATATVTVSVQDIEDELPIFHILEYKSSVPENVPEYLIIQVKVCILTSSSRSRYMDI